jgi:hypothetical protein
MEIAIIPAKQLQRVNWIFFCRWEKCLIWSVNCNYFIPKVIGQQVYWFIGNVRVLLAAGGALVAVKRSAVNRSAGVRTFLYLCHRRNVIPLALTSSPEWDRQRAGCLPPVCMPVRLHNLYSSPSISRVIKSRRMRWAGHAARMGGEEECV